MWSTPGGRSSPAARILRRPTAIAAGQQTAGGRRQSRRREGEPDEGDEADGPPRAPRAPGCKRTVAMHVGYVGTAFRGEDGGEVMACMASVLVRSTGSLDHPRR